MTEDLLRRDREFIWHPFSVLNSTEKNLLIKSAKGVYLHTADGRKIIDAVSSWWVNTHGHSNEYIAKAIAQQALTLEHVIFAGFSHEPAITLAERLIGILPGNQKKIFFSDDGSTAVEVGLKMAFQYWYNKGTARTKVIALQGAYHGDTFGAMSVGSRGEFNKPFSSLLFDVEFLDFPLEGKEKNTEEQFKNLIKDDDVASFIYEPLIQGAAGMRTYSPQLLESLLKISKDHGIICIADEVMTGFGRTGKLFASDHLNVFPDIICLSKGLTGGTMALGVTSGNSKIVEAFSGEIIGSEEILRSFFHGHSFTGNPIACAAANASLDLLLKDECQQQIKMIGESHKKFVERIQAHPKIKKINLIGTIISLELETKDSTSYFNGIRDYLYNFFLEKDILLRPLGNVIYIFPPFIISLEELEIVYIRIQELLKNL